MAEFLFKYMVKEMGYENKFHIESRATSTEELGNKIHSGTRKILDQYNIDYKNKRAERISQADYDYYDYILIMDEYNRYNIEYRIKDINHKIHLLLDYTDLKRDIADPWYTGNFKATYDDIMIGLDGFLNYLKSNKLI